MTAPVRLIETWGSPAERGERYGAAAKPEIARGIAHYRAQIERSGVGAAALDDLVERYLPLIAAFDAGQVAEMRGIARGADVPLAHIVLLNARTELLKLAGNSALRAGLEAARGEEGCSTIVVQPERSATSALIHAHNWDWKPECAHSCVVLRVRDDDGPDLLTFTEAGGLARFGFNSAGIAVTGNYLECERDYTQLGVPLALIRRKALQAATPAEAFSTIYCTPKSASNNLALSHAPTGVVHDLECAPDETFVVEPENGLLIHTNHWLSPIALTKLRERGIADSPCSHFRAQRLARLLADVERIDLATVKRVLRDDAGSPLSICAPVRHSALNGSGATVATVIMQPASGVLDVAMMPALGGDYHRYTLDETVAPLVAYG